MSTYKHKEGRGSLFKNTYKEKDTQPDLRGTMTDLSGKEFEISAWEGQTQAGDFQSKLVSLIKKLKGNLILLRRRTTYPFSLISFFHSRGEVVCFHINWFSSSLFLI